MELADMSVQGLTPEEIEVLERVGQVCYAFEALPRAHPSDLDELVFHAHALGRIVMARAAVRAHPDRWQFR